MIREWPTLSWQEWMVICLPGPPSILPRILPEANKSTLEIYMNKGQHSTCSYYVERQRPPKNCFSTWKSTTVNQQILAAIKFGVSQNKVIYVNLAAIKFGVSPWPVYVVYDRRICWWRQILAKTRNSPNSPNIIARQNLLIYSKGNGWWTGSTR